RAREEAEGATRDAEGTTRGRSKEDADRAIHEAAEKARRAQHEQAGQLGGASPAPGLDPLQQQDTAVPDLPEQADAQRAVAQPVDPRQGGQSSDPQHSWQRAEGERSSWESTGRDG